MRPTGGQGGDLGGALLAALAVQAAVVAACALVGAIVLGPLRAPRARALALPGRPGGSSREPWPAGRTAWPCRARRCGL
jgi:hypothetical protein